MIQTSKVKQVFSNAGLQVRAGTLEALDRVYHQKLERLAQAIVKEGRKSVSPTDVTVPPVSQRQPKQAQQQLRPVDKCQRCIHLDAATVRIANKMQLEINEIKANIKFNGG